MPRAAVVKFFRPAWSEAVMNTRRELLLGIGLCASGVTLLEAQTPDSAAQTRVTQAAGAALQSQRSAPLPVRPGVSLPLVDPRVGAGARPPDLCRRAEAGVEGWRAADQVAAAASRPDGRQFFFRSVDKDPSATLPPELRATVAGDVVRDQTSSALPTATARGRSACSSAAGIPHGKLACTSCLMIRVWESSG